MGNAFGFGVQAPPGGSVHHKSFFERMGNAIVGVFIGVFLFVGGLGVIGWNEGRAVHTSCAIYEAGASLKEADCTKKSDLDNLLVHLACDINKTTSVSPFAYSALNIAGTGLTFSATLEQYQTKESKSCSTKKDSVGGGSTEVCTYSYDYAWQSSQASSFESPDRRSVPSYKGDNPSFPSLPGLPTSEQSATVYLGVGYFLNKEMISAAARPAVTVAPSPQLSSFADSNLWNPFQTNNPGAAPHEIVNNPGGGSNFRYDNSRFVTYPLTPRVGDLRIQFSITQPVDSFGVMAKQLPDGRFESATFEKCSGYGFIEYQAGKPSAQDLINKATSENTTLTWVFRILCFFVLWMGLQLCFGPCMLVPDLIPCIGPYISDLVGYLLCCATCIAATFWFCLVVAISWIYFRPMIGIPLFIVAVAAGVGLVVWRVKNKQQKHANNGDNEAGQYQPVSTPQQQGYNYPPPGQQGYPPPQQGGYPPPQQGGYPPPGGYR